MSPLFVASASQLAVAPGIFGSWSAPCATKRVSMPSVYSIRLLLAVCLMALVPFAISTRAAAESTGDMQNIKQEIESLRATQAGMQKELQEIKALLQKLSAAAAAEAATPAAGAEFSLEGAQMKGASDARVVLVEFSDFQCPFCARYATGSYPQIVRDYVDSGRVRYAFMNFPIESLHPAAFKQHVAAACAADQGRFWEMHDRLVADQKAADTRALAGHATAIGLDAAKFRACLDGDAHVAAIRKSMKTGEAIGVNGTPTFLIGMLGSDQIFKASKVVSGARPYSAFKEAIDGVLATTAAGADSSPAEHAVATAGWKRVIEIKQ